MKRITVGELRRALERFDDKLHVSVLLPGSRIDLSGEPFFLHDVFAGIGAEVVLLEGNVREGSVLR